MGAYAIGLAVGFAFLLFGNKYKIQGALTGAARSSSLPSGTGMNGSANVSQASSSPCGCKGSVPAPAPSGPVEAPGPVVAAPGHHYLVGTR